MEDVHMMLPTQVRAERLGEQLGGAHNGERKAYLVKTVADASELRGKLAG